MDFVNGLPPSNRPSVILTIVDCFSKDTHFVPLPKLSSAVETGDLLARHVFCLHGIPRDIVSDRGPQFTSRVWRCFCTALGALVLSPPVQRPNGADQPEPEEHAQVRDGLTSSRLELLPAVDRVCTQLAGVSCVRSVSFHGVAGLPTPAV